MADYWAKIYIEILDDPKMATLPDRLWRRVIELILLAKRLGKDGHLPDTPQIAWLLRMDPNELESDMAQIAPTGIAEREEGGWFLPKFAQRQAAASSTERVQQHRERKKKQEYYVNETETERNVAQINRLTEAETDTDAEQKQKREPAAAPLSNGDAAATKIYTQVTGHMTFPGPIPEKIDAEQTIRQIIATREDPVGYLMPFWDEWQRRQYSPTNTAWLTSWAATGVIPPPRKKAEKPASQRSAGEAFEKTKQVTEEWLRSKNNGQ